MGTFVHPNCWALLIFKPNQSPDHGLETCNPWSKFGLLLAFINKILLECGPTYLFSWCLLLTCMSMFFTTAELSNCNGDCMVHKMFISNPSRKSELNLAQWGRDRRNKHMLKRWLTSLASHWGWCAMWGSWGWSGLLTQPVSHGAGTWTHVSPSTSPDFFQLRGVPDIISHSCWDS
jgi:hypothetical protein